MRSFYGTASAEGGTLRDRGVKRRCRGRFGLEAVPERCQGVENGSVGDTARVWPGVTLRGGAGALRPSGVCVFYGGISPPR